MKFVLDEPILSSGSRQYDHAPENDPFAARLFEIPGVRSAYVMENFITLDRDAYDWIGVEDQLNEILAEGHAIESVAAQPESGDDLLDRINGILDTKVRPALAGDGGGLEILGIKGNDLVIRYQGACGTCPSAAQGTMYAIQNLLRYELNQEINVVPG